jgi:protein involved in polysaccharide export with SLBB domain
MDVGALLRSFDDVLPEPAERAEIVRLEPPDYRPKVISFALSEVLGGTDPVELKPFDTIRIYGRYEADAPKVRIVGEVLRPGEYPLRDGMTAGMLVQMAGGFKRSAYTDAADIASYSVQNGKMVARQHTSFAVGRALAGEHDADVVLKAGDVISIRQLTGWADIGASVVLNGEVRYPGTYGIEDGERLSSVMERAGGLRSTAYPEGAMLERPEVRALAEKSRAELIRQIETATPESKLRGASLGDAAAAAQLMEQQQRQILTTLHQEEPTGRLVIKINSDVARWQNTEADPELRAGDVITIPKRPNFVLITGQVYNPAAIGYTSGKPAQWYLRQAGGPNESANKKRIFIVRANGSVLAGSGEGLWHEGVLDARLQPGDTLVVPERIAGGSAFWKNLLSTAQVTSSIAVAARIATSF